MTDHQTIFKHHTKKMVFQIRIVTTMIILLLVTRMFINEAQAQVTFSRDWNPGKRAENSDFHNAMKTVTTVCHLLVNQVRQIASCENNREDMDAAASAIFTGRR